MEGRGGDRAPPPSQRDQVLRLVESVCAVEMRGLREHFSDDRYAGKDAVLAPMVRVLEGLPGGVRGALEEADGGEGGGGGVHFLAEVSPRERVETAAIGAVLKVGMSCMCPDSVRPDVPPVLIATRGGAGGAGEVQEPHGGSRDRQRGVCE